MVSKVNKRLIAWLIAVATSGYVLWLTLTPVKIMAVHDGNTILVRNFPYLKNRQIAWWKANRGMIQAKYGIPHKNGNGYYSVVIMDFGDGYHIDDGKEHDSDLLCFNEMVTHARCIKKNPLLWIMSSQNTGLFYR